MAADAQWLNSTCETFSDKIKNLMTQPSQSEVENFKYNKREYVPIVLYHTKGH